MMPTHIKESLDLYVSKRYQPGGFLTAVLENNLEKAIANADSESLESLKAICLFVYNKMPGNCYGSPARVAAWLNREE